MRDHGVNMLVKTSQGSFQPISDIVTDLDIVFLYSIATPVYRAGWIIVLSLSISVYFFLFMYCFVKVKIPVCMLKSTLTHCCHAQFFPLKYIVITRCPFNDIFSR